MAGRRIFTRPGRRTGDSDRMDVIALALGLMVFAAMLALLEGLERL
jgi:hypothetical protein